MSKAKITEGQKRKLLERDCFYRRLSGKCSTCRRECVRKDLHPVDYVQKCS